MKFIVNIPDAKAESFQELLKSHFNIKAKSLSIVDAAVLEELTRIRKAFKLADKVQAGKLKTRPASELLDEL